jgi:hypothetical protein
MLVLELGKEHLKDLQKTDELERIAGEALPAYPVTSIKVVVRR